MQARRRLEGAHEPADVWFRAAGYAARSQPAGALVLDELPPHIARMRGRRVAETLANDGGAQPVSLPFRKRGIAVEPAAGAPPASRPPVPFDKYVRHRFEISTGLCGPEGAALGGLEPGARDAATRYWQQRLDSEPAVREAFDELWRKYSA